jgi:hypothetical protein
MKQNNKAKLLAILMFLQTIIANAKEGVVIRLVDNKETGTTSVLIDTSGNGFPDTNLYIPFTNESASMAFIRDSILQGSRVEKEDSYTLPQKAMGMDVVPITGLLKINNVT